MCKYVSHACINELGFKHITFEPCHCNNVQISMNVRIVTAMRMPSALTPMDLPSARVTVDTLELGMHVQVRFVG